MTTVTEVAASLNRRHPAGRRLPAVLLLTDARRLPDPLAAAACLPPGAMIILRHYEAPNRARLAADLARLCRARSVLLSIAGDARLARTIGADGVHLPEHALKGGRRADADPRLLVTAAAHSLPALHRAAMAGADAALLSPVFATASHPGAPTLGPARFARLIAAASLPVYALGGIEAANAGRLRASGAVGIAAIGAYLREFGVG